MRDRTVSTEPDLICGMLCVFMLVRRWVMTWWPRTLGASRYRGWAVVLV